MACFPRFRRTKKNSFNPAIDGNADPILNTADCTVQIGRYIRREETSLYTPKSSQTESLKQREILKSTTTTSSNYQQQQQPPANNSKYSSSTSSNNNVGKKYISNKYNSNNKSNNYNDNSFITTNNNPLHHSNSTKLKPVKERRPTALPTDVPRIEEDFIVEPDGSSTPTLTITTSPINGFAYDPSIPDTPTSLQNVRFFIGGGAGGGAGSTSIDGGGSGSMQYDDATSAELAAPVDTSNNNTTNNNNTLHIPRTHSSTNLGYLGSGSKYASQASMLSLDNTSNYNGKALIPINGESITTAAAAATTTPTSRTPSLNNSASYTTFRLKTTAKFSSSSSTGSISGRRRAGGPHRNMELLNIPTPPPLPPQPLTTASSSASFRSEKSITKKKQLEQEQEQRRNSNLNMSPARKSSCSSENVRNTAKIAASTSSTPSSKANAKCNSLADYDDGNDDDDDDLQMCTIAEVLNLSNSKATTKTKTAKTAKTTTKTTTGNSLNGRDSGVQVEYQLPTPKISDDSDDSLKQQRVDGGIIFMRPNLPSKKDVKIQFIEKDKRTRNLIRNAIEKNDFLNNYMDKERKELCIDAMSTATYEKGSFIIKENDEGSEIYVSEDGSFDVLKGKEVVGSFGPATVFGELAILYNANRLASVKATSHARVWKIDRVTFRQIMMLTESREKEENVNFLRSAPFLNDLPESVLTKVVDLLQRKFYETNTCIVREGEVGNEFFIIRGGTVTIKKKIDGIESIVDRRKRGEYFGEQALLNADCRQASVFADAPGTEVLKLDREAFISYLGTIPQLREIPGNTDSVHGRQSNRKSEFDNEYAHIQLAELKKIAILGAGAFGRVDLVAYGSKTMALKIIKKIDIIKQDQVEHVYSEKHVMMKCRSCPFIIQLYKTFRNEKFVYFLMEACMGGDVWTIMSQRRFFDEKTARFIAGCVVEAFDFLHSHNIIYRDLKPENLMLTTDGYCKLVDFGFAKHIPPNQKTNTFAGTPEYVAPEIILDRGHDRSVDYWALGILIFELLVGKTPFRGQNQIKIYQQILGGIDVIQMPSKIPKSAQGLIKQLCKQLPAERLGYQRKGIQDIKKHTWFDGNLDWNKLKYKKLQSPIKRPITSNTDLQYFGPAGVENDHDPPDETSGWDIDF